MELFEKEFFKGVLFVESQTAIDLLFLGIEEKGQFVIGENDVWLMFLGAHENIFDFLSAWNGFAFFGECLDLQLGETLKSYFFHALSIKPKKKSKKSGLYIIRKKKSLPGGRLNYRYRPT
jgi:hypothetical protein